MSTHRKIIPELTGDKVPETANPGDAENGVLRLGATPCSPAAILCPECHGFGGDDETAVCDNCAGFGEIEDPNFSEENDGSETRPQNSDSQQ